MHYWTVSKTASFLICGEREKNHVVDRVFITSIKLLLFLLPNHTIWMQCTEGRVDTEDPHQQPILRPRGFHPLLFMAVCAIAIFMVVRSSLDFLLLSTGIALEVYAGPWKSMLALKKMHFRQCRGKKSQLYPMCMLSILNHRAHKTIGYH